jgi:xanthine dehydrogenase accessory factor
VSTTDLLDLARELSRREVPFALATVVRREAPVSARPGDKAIVLGDGTLQGWVGGSCAHEAVVTTARRALGDGRPRLLVLDAAPEPGAPPRAGVEVFPMRCHSGGALEIYIEPQLPKPRLVLLGASPVAEALARLGKVVGYRVFVVDPEAPAERYADADGLFGDYGDAGPWGGSETFVLVGTMGRADEAALAAAVRHDPDYVAVVASTRRYGEVRRRLEEAGVPAAQLDRVKNPAGLDISAWLPEEIAVSVLAEIVQVRRRASATGTGAQAEARDLAVDPVCGMTVDPASATITLERAGVRYAFCCAACRARFVERLAAEGAPDAA